MAPLFLFAVEGSPCAHPSAGELRLQDLLPAVLLSLLHLLSLGDGKAAHLSQDLRIKPGLEVKLLY